MAKLLTTDHQTVPTRCDAKTGFSALAVMALLDCYDYDYLELNNGEIAIVSLSDPKQVNKLATEYVAEHSDFKHTVRGHVLICSHEEAGV